MSLEEYRTKRTFDKTPEPAGDSETSTDRLCFVVQKHAASHLHYDVRLEVNGVLKSWAVPKGPSLNPKDKRLAMMTEDHPLEYRHFEGTIPEDNYGAGQVIIWDEGTYEPLTDNADPEKGVRHALHKGKLSFTLNGQRLKGEFTLVRAKKPKSDSSWLLIKKSDSFADKGDVTQYNRSIVSDRSVEDIPDCAPFPTQLWRSIPKDAELPTPVKPMLATLVEEPFDDESWVYEVKWDGYRAVAELADSGTKLYSRNHNSYKDKFPSIYEELNNLNLKAVFDGEVITPDEEGKPDFSRLQNYDPDSDQPIMYHVFDLLSFNGVDLTDRTLRERKRILKGLLSTKSTVRYSEHISKTGIGLFNLAGERGLEGIIAKKADGTYLQGKRVKDWLKIKVQRRQEAVVGGYTEPRGSRKYFGALVLGLYADGKLEYIGHSGTGLSEAQRRDWYEKLSKLTQNKSPFKNTPKTNAPVHWVQPKLLCEVSFAEWTKGGHMRQPKILGLREDKAPEQVSKEVPQDRRIKKSVKKETKRFKLTNERKIFWPKYNKTKGDLFSYYQSVMETALPYAVNRPMTLLRHPNGVDGKSFFQKDVAGMVPDWIQTLTRHSKSNNKDISYYVCTDEDSFLYMIQLGCIEINPWLSTTDQPEEPDYGVIDLDPLGVPFSTVVDVAQHTHAYLEELDIPNFVKTSGKKGLHILIPLAAGYTYDQSKQFTELLVRNIDQEIPSPTSIERSPKKRKGKVYLDFLQNRLSQTIAAPYSARPTKEATVSTPLEWQEVNDKLAPTNFTMDSVIQRLNDTGNVWRRMDEHKLHIEEALNSLERA